MYTCRQERRRAAFSESVSPGGRIGYNSDYQPEKLTECCMMHQITYTVGISYQHSENASLAETSVFIKELFWNQLWNLLQAMNSLRRYDSNLLVDNYCTDSHKNWRKNRLEAARAIAEVSVFLLVFVHLFR